MFKTGLNEIEAFIQSQQELDDEQKETLHRRFEYLINAAKRKLGRVDLLNIFVAQVFASTTTGIINSSLFWTVMRHASAKLETLFRFGQHLIGG